MVLSPSLLNVAGFETRNLPGKRVSRFLSLEPKSYKFTVLEVKVTRKQRGENFYFRFCYWE